MSTTTAPRPIAIVDRGLFQRLQDRDLGRPLVWGPQAGTCACGLGCKGKESLSHAGIRSERDARTVDAATRGWTMEEYLAAFGITDAGKVSQADPKRDQGPQVPMDPDKRARQAEAMAYLNAYQGTWDFLLTLKADSKRLGGHRFRLTDRMVEVILGSKAREAKWAQERAEAEKALDAGQVSQPKVPAATTVDLRQVPQGHYAVINGSGEVTFLRIDRPDEGKWEGWVFVKVQVSDDYQRIGAQRPQEPTYRGQWPALLAQVIADPQECAKRYGQAIGRCASCHRTLTNAESREYGIGPECRGKWS